VAPEDERLGRLLRTIRRRADMTQEELSVAASVPVRDVIHAENGRIGRLELDRVRRLFMAAGGRARLTAWYNGALADRLLDERHAGLGERLVEVHAARRWQTEIEVTFSEYGERGSIDVFGAYPATRAAGVFEIKSDFGSIEEMNRSFDVKVRLAPKLAVARFGFRPAYVGRLLVLPEDRTLRRLVNRYGQTMASVYPARSREVRAWLRRPDRDISGIWFLTELPNAPAIEH
jgi:transcriptional regulator with XRE-family HTH domain